MKSAEQIIEDMLEEDRRAEEAPLDTCLAVLADAKAMQDEAAVKKRVRDMLLDRLGPRLGPATVRLLNAERSWREYGRDARSLLDRQNRSLFLACGGNGSLLKRKG